MSAMQPGRPGAPHRQSTSPDDTTAAQPGQESASPPAVATTGSDDLEQRPLAEQADHFQQLHADLQAALADIDNA